MMTSSTTETEARMAEMRAEIERLREALAPFACRNLEWLILDTEGGHNYEVCLDIGDARCAVCGSNDLDDMEWSGFTVEDIRRVRRALGEAGRG